MLIHEHVVHVYLVHNVNVYTHSGPCISLQVQRVLHGTTLQANDVLV